MMFQAPHYFSCFAEHVEHSLSLRGKNFVLQTMRLKNAEVPDKETAMFSGHSCSTTRLRLLTRNEAKIVPVLNRLNITPRRRAGNVCVCVCVCVYIYIYIYIYRGARGIVVVKSPFYKPEGRGFDFR
jgi:hypothetical protein